MSHSRNAQFGGLKMPRWVLQAACTTNDALWFPVGKSIETANAREQAEAVCWSCPVREQCLDWSLDVREPHGTWGGVDEEERAKLLARKDRLERRRALVDSAVAS